MKIKTDGTTKWVTPEKALAVSKEKRIQEEAKTKIKRREELERTIKGRFEREVREARTETARKIAEKKAVKLVEVEKEKREIVKPKRPLELFSPEARRRLGLTETPEGLLEIKKDKRKIVVEPRRVELRKTFIELVEDPFKKKEEIRQEVIAELPVSAEFRTGFEKQLGKGIKEEKLVGLKTPSGVLTFKTIEEPVSRKLKKAFRPSVEFFEERELKLRRELRGRPSIIKDRQFKKLGIEELRTIQLRAGQLIVGGEIGARRQITEEPLETAAIITAGAAFGAVAAKPAIAKAAAFRISSTVLGTTFVGVTGVEAGLQIRRGRFAEAGEIIGERAAEALLFIGAGRLGVRGVKGVRKVRFERGIKRFERKIPKFTDKELKARLGTGGIRTKTPREIQTTFKKDIRVISKEQATRIRIFEKAKSPLKRPQPPGRIAIIKTSDIPGEPKIVTLEEIGKFDTSLLRKVGKDFTKIRIRVGRLKDITIRDTGIQKVLAETKLRTGRFRILPEPPKFKPPIEKIPKPFKGKTPERLNLKLISQKQERLKIIKSIEDFSGKPGKLTPQEFARQKGFLFVEPPAERPRIDITQFAGKEIRPGGVLTSRGAIKSPARVTLPVSLGLFGVIKGLGIGEAQDIVSGQKLRTRLEVSKKLQQDLASDLGRITGTKPKAAFDIASGLASVQDIDVIKEHEQLLITIPRPRVPERGRPEFPPPELPPKPPPPPPPPPLLFPFIPKLFLGVPIKRKRRPLRQEFGFTPGFISSVLGEFGPPPRPGQIFTGQERRFIIKGKPFLTPLPERREGIIQLVARQLGA